MCVFPDGGRRCDGISEGEDIGRRGKLEQLNEAGIWVATSSLPLIGNGAVKVCLVKHSKVGTDYIIAFEYYQTMLIMKYYSTV